MFACVRLLVEAASEGKGERKCRVEDGRGHMCEEERGGERERACMTFGNIVILIPRRGLSPGLQQDYSSGPIIT